MIRSSAFAALTVLIATLATADTSVKVDVRLFSVQERDAITLHYQQREADRKTYEQYHEQGGKKKHDKALPPGLQKKAARGGELPPGWQKKLQRGQLIDPLVYARCEPLEPHLLARLPVGPAGTVTVYVEGRVVRLLEKTREIIDILEM